MRGSRQIAGEVEVDLGRYELRRFGRRVKLEKKPMELLIFLLGRREQMVSREEIVRKLWRSDLFIDAGKNVNNIVRKLRTPLGDKADKPRFLETVVGKGYRFVGAVRVIGPHPSRNSAPLNGRNDQGEWGERSSIAVLPLLSLTPPKGQSGSLAISEGDVLTGKFKTAEVGSTSTPDRFPRRETSASANPRHRP